MMEGSFGIRRRYASRRQWGHGRDRIVTDHPADLFHQVVLDGDVFGSAPCRHAYRERPRPGLLDFEFERLENFSNFCRWDEAAQLAIQPIQRQFDWSRLRKRA